MPEKSNAQTQIIERDLDRLGERFDRHLEIYAANGKELAALKSSVDYMHKSFETHFKDTVKEQDNQWVAINKTHKDVNEMQVTLSNNTVKLAFYSSVGAALGAAALSVAVNQLFV